MSFNFLNYYTRYRVALNFDGTNINFSREASCFASLFGRFDNDDIYDGSIEIDICHTEEWAEESKSNCMLLSNEEFEWYISELKKTINFDHSIIDKDRYFTIKVDLQKKHHYEVKWIVSSIRNVYEFPQNVSLKEAVTLYKMGLFPEEDNIINVFNVVLTTSSERLGGQVVACFDINNIPGISSVNEIKERINRFKKFNERKLNDLYALINHNGENVLSLRIGSLRKFFKSDYLDEIKSEFFEEELAYRFKLIYNPIYKKIKTLKNAS